MTKKLLVFSIVIFQPIACMDFNSKNGGHFGPSPEKIVALYDHQKDQKSSVYKHNLELIGTINKEVNTHLLETCTICQETRFDTKNIDWANSDNCNHLFHAPCIKQWQKSDSDERNLCPLCKKTYTTLPEKHRVFTTTMYNELTDEFTLLALSASSGSILGVEISLKLLDWSFKKYPHFFKFQDLIFTKSGLMGVITGIISTCEFFSYLYPEEARVFRKYEGFMTLYFLLKFRRA